MAAFEHSMDANGAKDAPPPRHIVVLAHGLGGAASDFDRMAQCIRDAYPGRVIVYQADCYEGRTTEGIDVCGQQLYSKILELARHNNLEKGCFSILGHSLGGLISRFCVGLLHQTGFFKKFKPINFITLASPHLGTRRHENTNSFNAVINYFTASWPLGRTGRQLVYQDNAGQPLLVLLALSHEMFFQGLGRFRRRVLYSNVYDDMVVPYHTAAIASFNPYRVRNELDNKLVYPIILSRNQANEAVYANPVRSSPLPIFSRKSKAGDAPSPLTQSPARNSPSPSPSLSPSPSPSLSSPPSPGSSDQNDADHAVPTFLQAPVTAPPTRKSVAKANPNPVLTLSTNGAPLRSNSTHDIEAFSVSASGAEGSGSKLAPANSMLSVPKAGLSKCKSAPTSLADMEAQALVNNGGAKEATSFLNSQLSFWSLATLDDSTKLCPILSRPDATADRRTDDDVKTEHWKTVYVSLQSLEWERYDVIFNNNPFAHEDIIAKQASSPDAVPVHLCGSFEIE